MSFPDLQTIATISMIISSGATASALVFLYLQFRGDSRTRRFDTYEKLRSDFSDIVLELAGKPDVAELVYVKQNKPSMWGDGKTTAEKATYSYFDSLMGLFERAWVANRKISLGKDGWKPWESWLGDMLTIPMFREEFEENQPQFDKTFQIEVSRILVDLRKTGVISENP